MPQCAEYVRVCPRVKKIEIWKHFSCLNKRSGNMSWKILTGKAWSASMSLLL